MADVVAQGIEERSESGNSTASPQQGLCTACRHLTIEEASTITGYPLHNDLEEIVKCGSSCSVCQSIGRTFRKLLKDTVPRSRSKFSLSQRNFRVTLVLDRTHTTANYEPRTDGCIKAVVWDMTTGRPVNLNRCWDQTSTSIEQPSELRLPWFHIWVRDYGSGEVSELSTIRPLPYSTSAPATLALARSWVQPCVSGCCIGDGKHQLPNESKITPISKGPPRRLVQIVDISSGHLRLVDGDHCRDGYSALSYVWGDERPFWTTTMSNVYTRRSGFQIDELPQTLIDAIRITTEIGVHYIWVDALCILQDSLTDWEAEAGKMVDVYSGALVTLAAHCSTGSTSGMFNSHSRSHFDGWKPFMVLNGDVQNCHRKLYLDRQGPRLQWYESVRHSGLSTRAWCFQEYLLSPRILHWTEHQLMWECVHCIRSEDNYIKGDLHAHDSSALGPPPTDLGSLHYIRQLLLQKYRKPDYNTSTEEMAFHFWYMEIVSKDYSFRDLTKPRDKLIAIAGVAKSIQNVCPMPYHAGVWGHRVVEGLCWARDGTGRKATEYRAPSWSWASMDCPVSYLISMYKAGEASTKKRAEILDVEVETSSGDEFGLVTLAYLRLRAPAIRGRCLTRDPSEQGIPQSPHAGLVLPHQSTFVNGVTRQEGQRIQLMTDTGLWLLALMDNDFDEVHDLEVAVCLLFQYVDGPDYFFLLLAPSGAADNWVRVGLARPFHYGPEHVEPSEMLNEFIPSLMQTFTIV